MPGWRLRAPALGKFMADELLSRLKARDRRAQEELRAQMLDRVAAVCRHILGGSSGWREAAEDVWTDFLVEHVQMLRSSAAIAAYLRLMAVRRCTRLKEHQARHEPIGEPFEPAESTESPEDALVSNATARSQEAQLLSCLDKLHVRTRRIFRLRYHHDMTQGAIAEIFGLSKQYVGRVLARGLESLRQCMEKGE